MRLILMIRVQILIVHRQQKAGIFRPSQYLGLNPFSRPKKLMYSGTGIMQRKCKYQLIPLVINRFDLKPPAMQKNALVEHT